uniref:NAD-dependent lysine demalonylase and desuccinylase sirtuin-5, mitochondrial n=1 Tax=Lygus hesperus TaxID=30085 RepID=A0A146M9I3_LYGHE
MAGLSELPRLRGILSKAKNIVVLTGAGISAESGIPTFRGAGGFWRTYQSQDLATVGAFKRSPSLVWEFYHYRREMVFTKTPNKAHYAIAEAEANLAKAGRKLTIITQNIDGLHQAAGSKNVIELHGSLFKTQCTKCKDVRVNKDSPICEALRGKGELMEEALLAVGSSGQGVAAPLNPVTTGPTSQAPTSPQASSTGGNSGSDEGSGEKEDKPLTNRQKLKLFMRDYGSTVIVFHITQSLALLGIIYAAFSVGLDMTWVIEKLGLEGKYTSTAAGASTFVIAYAVNKVLAPLRFAITFSCTPFIVRYLRRIGFLKVK